MNREELLAFDRKHLWHPYASISAPPPVNLAVAAKGTHIRLDDGLELIDGISSWWCMAHGHNHPDIVAAIREQAGKFAQVRFAGFTHEPAIELAAELVKHTPAGVDKVFYADSGSVAVECAAKMAVQYQFAAGKPGRCRLRPARAGIDCDTLAASGRLRVVKVGPCRVDGEHVSSTVIRRLLDEGKTAEAELLLGYSLQTEK